MDKAQQDRVSSRDPSTRGVFEISENFVSIFALGPVTEGTARLIARAIPGARTFPTWATPATQHPPPSGVGASAEFVVDLPVMPNERGETAKLQRALVNLGRARLTLILYRTGLVARSDTATTVEFRSQSPTRLNVKVSRILSAASVAALRTDVVLLTLLLIVIRLGDGRPPATCRVTLPPYLPDRRIDLRNIGDAGLFLD